MLFEYLFPTKNSQLALKTGVPVGNIHNVIIWGNHSATQYPDAEHGYVTNTPVPGLTLVRPTPFPSPLSSCLRLCASWFDACG